MSRITGADALGLMEAYNSVYAPEITEEQIWEEVEIWVNSLVEEGYDLSDYTWEDMYEEYLAEVPINPSGQTPTQSRQRSQQAASGMAKVGQRVGDYVKGVATLNPMAIGPTIANAITKGLSQATSNYQSQGPRDTLGRPTRQQPTSTQRQGPPTPQRQGPPVPERLQRPTPRDAVEYSPRAARQQAPVRQQAPTSSARPAPRTVQQTPTRQQPTGSRSVAPSPPPSTQRDIGAPPPPVAAVPVAAPATPVVAAPVAAVPSPTLRPSFVGSTGTGREAMIAGNIARARMASATPQVVPVAAPVAAPAVTPTTQAFTTPLTNVPRPAVGRYSGSFNRQRLNASFDPFDVVLEHLIEEGYAETYEDAIVIMTNMSEEWKDHIMNEEKKRMRIKRPSGTTNLSHMGIHGRTQKHKKNMKPLIDPKPDPRDYDDDSDHPSLTARERNPNLR